MKNKLRKQMKLIKINNKNNQKMKNIIKLP